MTARSSAIIEKQSPCHFRAELNGRAVGVFGTLDDAREGIAQAMLSRHGMARVDGRLFTPAPAPIPGQLGIDAAEGWEG